MVRLNHMSKFRTQNGYTRIDLFSTERVSILSTSRFLLERGRNYFPMPPNS